jgi:hypothetical protein
MKRLSGYAAWFGREGVSRLLFMCALAYMAFLACEYSRCWMDTDYPIKFFSRAIGNGPRLVPGDFTRIFDPGPAGFRIGPPSRLRYVQDLVALIDIKFRIWLFNYLPPHPSASLVWVFVFALSPFFMFKLVNNLTRSRPAAWSGTILFCLSTGNLFAITKFSNPAKPLANFSGILAFYLASLADRSARADGRLSPRGRWLYLLLLAVLFLSFFVDETAWMLYFMIPVLFPALFCRRRIRRFSIGGYLLLLLTALAFVFWVFPSLQAHYASGGARVDMIYDYLQAEDAGPPVPPFFGPRYVLVTARNLFWTQLVPWGRPWWGIVCLPLLLAFCVQRFRSLPPPLRALLLRTLAVLGIFIVLQSFAIAKVYWEEGYILKYPCYYGALFSLCLALPLAVLFAAPSGLRGRLFGQGVLVYLALVLAYNFARINEDVRFLQALYENAGEIDYPTAREAWRRRDDPRAVREMRARYPRWSPWLYIQEIEVVAEQRAAKRGMRETIDDDDDRGD